MTHSRVIGLGTERGSKPSVRDLRNLLLALEHNLLLLGFSKRMLENAFDVSVIILPEIFLPVYSPHSSPPR